MTSKPDLDHPINDIHLAENIGDIDGVASLVSMAQYLHKRKLACRAAIHTQSMAVILSRNVSDELKAVWRAAERHHRKGELYTGDALDKAIEEYEEEQLNG